ncbi:MAG: hypothetical protein ACOC8B_05985 [Gemmatimonadota bacterium]
MRKILLAMLLAAVPALDSAAHAQEQAPAATPLVLTLPAGARSLALGEAFVTVDEDDPDAIVHNPSLLASTDAVGISVHRYGSSGTFAALNAASPLGPGTLGAAARFLDFHAVQVEPSTGPGAGPVTVARALLFEGDAGPASSAAATVGYGISFGDPDPTWLDDIRVGAAVHALRQATPGSRGVGWALDVGTAAELADVMVSLAVQGLGPELELDGEAEPVPLPRRAVLTAAHESTPVGPFDLIAAATVTAYDDVDAAGDGLDLALAPGIGLELAYWPIRGRTFFARFGFRNDPYGVLEPLTLGAGFEADAFALDYAFENARGGLGAAHRIGLRWWGTD